MAPDYNRSETYEFSVTNVTDGDTLDVEFSDGTTEELRVIGIDASGFQRGQASSHYRKRADYSFQAMKTTLLVDTDSLAIMDVYFTTKKAYDGHIGLQVFRRTPETCGNSSRTKCIRGVTCVRNAVLKRRVQ